MQISHNSACLWLREARRRHGRFRHTFADDFHQIVIGSGVPELGVSELDTGRQITVGPMAETAMNPEESRTVFLRGQYPGRQDEEPGS